MVSKQAWQTLLFLLALLVADARCVQCENYALVVGVNHCPNFHRQGGAVAKPLQGAERDAEAFAAILIDKFDFKQSHVKMLKGREATLAKFRSASSLIAKQLHPEDSFVFYFSGHGTQRKESAPPIDEKDRLDEALCLFDSKPDGEDLLIDDEVGKWLASIPAENITVLLDCCHSGTATKNATDEDIVARYLPVDLSNNRSPQDANWKDLQTSTKDGRRIAVFYACRSDQQAYERLFPSLKSRAGQFTYYFLEASKTSKADSNSDGELSQREVLEYISSRLNLSFNQVRTDAKSCQQPDLTSDNVDLPLFWLPAIKKRP